MFCLDIKQGLICEKCVRLFRDVNNRYLRLPIPYLFFSSAPSSSTLHPAALALLNYEQPAKLLSYVKEDRCPFVAVDTALRKGLGCEVHACTCACAYVSAFALWTITVREKRREEKARIASANVAATNSRSLAGNRRASNFFFTEGAIRWMSGFRGQEVQNSRSRKRAAALPELPRR